MYTLIKVSDMHKQIIVQGLESVRYEQFSVLFPSQSAPICTYRLVKFHVNMKVLLRTITNS